MFVLGEGRLKFGNGNITDGVNYFKTISPFLLFKVGRKKRDNSIVGKWLAYNDVILWFKKTRLNNVFIKE